MGKRLPHLWFIIEHEIKLLVAKDELGKASELLLEVTEVFGSSHNGEALLIARRVNKLLKEQNLGLFDYKTLTEEGSRIALCIIGILDSISSPIHANS